MGWTNSHQWRWDGPGDGEYRNDPPDLFTDANDDYAVLEFFRDHKDHRKAFEKALVLSRENMGVIWRYKVGAYARAAVKALERVSTELAPLEENYGK